MALRQRGREGADALPVMERSGMMLGGGAVGTRGRAFLPARVTSISRQSWGSSSKGRDGAMAAEILGQLQITQHCAADAYSRLWSREGPFGRPPARAWGKGDCARMFVICEGQNSASLFAAMARRLAVGRENQQQP